MELPLKSWSDFEGALHRISVVRQERAAESGRRFHNFLFRGLGNSKWGLETTLERSHPSERGNSTLSILKHYGVIDACKPAIETFSDSRWDKFLAFPDFKKRVEKGFQTSTWLDMLLTGTPDFYEYLVYLRHHGFPSPLLDWSASPYVAAFFAFNSPPKEAEQVAIHGLMQDTVSGASSDAHLFIVGSHLRAHARHLLQQCSYTMCVALDVQNQDWVFRPHTSGLHDAMGPLGELFTITMPTTDRVAALKQLELMNINEFSLFGSEDSLIRTVARRELLFRN